MAPKKRTRAVAEEVPEVPPAAEEPVATKTSNKKAKTAASASKHVIIEHCKSW